MNITFGILFYLEIIILLKFYYILCTCNVPFHLAQSSKANVLKALCACQSCQLSF